MPSWMMLSFFCPWKCDILLTFDWLFTVCFPSSSAILWSMEYMPIIISNNRAKKVTVQTTTPLRGAIFAKDSTIARKIPQKRTQQHRKYKIHLLWNRLSLSSTISGGTSIQESNSEILKQKTVTKTQHAKTSEKPPGQASYAHHIVDTMVLIESW